jgi:hypothetical protein
MGFAELLTLLFIGLKLTNCIDWSWWYVLSPTLSSLVIYAAIAAYLIFRKS